MTFLREFVLSVCVCSVLGALVVGTLNEEHVA